MRYPIDLLQKELRVLEVSLSEKRLDLDRVSESKRYFLEQEISMPAEKIEQFKRAIRTLSAQG